MQRCERTKAWQALAVAPFCLALAAPYCLALAALCLALAPPLAFAGDHAVSTTDDPPSVGGDVNISVKTGSVTTRGAKARNCIGSMPEGHVAGDVSITVNGEEVNGNHGCVTGNDLLAE